MKELIQVFPGQLEEGVEIGRKARISLPENSLKHILIIGMGGSGIGGKIVATLISGTCPLPILFSQDYELPGWADPHTLGIASSYSGNTEETLSATRALLNREAKVVMVTSGGELARLAEEHWQDIVLLPSGQPAPRACLGYSVAAQLFVLHKLELVEEEVGEKLLEVATFLRREQDRIREKAEQLAFLLQNKTPVIYSSPQFEAAGLRFCQQLNENAKILAWRNVIPEMNHNEIVGWQQHTDHLAVIQLLSELDHPRNRMRNAFVREIASHFAGSSINLKARGKDLWEQMFYFIHLFDWTSYYLAGLRGVDPMSIKAIDALKKMLGS